VIWLYQSWRTEGCDSQKNNCNTTQHGKPDYKLCGGISGQKALKSSKSTLFIATNERILASERSYPGNHTMLCDNCTNSHARISTYMNKILRCDECAYFHARMFVQAWITFCAAKNVRIFTLRVKVISGVLVSTTDCRIMRAMHGDTHM